MDVKGVIRHLEGVLEETRETLVRSAGGVSVCSLHKHGKPTDVLKYSEGKEFVIRRTIALLNREAGEAAILAFLSDQAAKFHKYSTSRIASSAWQAYADGGLDAIKRIEDTLHTPSP